MTVEPNSSLTQPIPPEYCQYAGGPCDQDFEHLTNKDGFFVYPSDPANLAEASKSAAQELRRRPTANQWVTWEELTNSGQIIFCEICKTLRECDRVIGDVTKLNFNVLFELGYALGLGKPLVPVRDNSYPATHLSDIGILDAVGYKTFQNGSELAAAASAARNSEPFKPHGLQPNRKLPIYYIKSPINSDGSIKLSSKQKKRYFRFRAFDAHETPRLSLHDARREVMTSLGVVAHLMDPNREGAEIHNGRCAFLCGMAMAAERVVLMVQEGFSTQPIDYRDTVRHYQNSDQIPNLVEPFLRSLADAIQGGSAPIPHRASRLESIDLGDVAAENEIEALQAYFVKTPQYQQTIQGHSRIVVGRKGSGKTAIFYGVRNRLRHKRNCITLDLKPEGHQLIKLRDAILVKLQEGYQDHTLVMFWEYLILLELTKKVLARRAAEAYSNPNSLREYQSLEAVYSEHQVDASGDFSERILGLIERMIHRFGKLDEKPFSSDDVTQLVYTTDVHELKRSITQYLGDDAEIWILFDNIDKGWPARGTRSEDISIVRGLLEASRRVQRAFSQKGITTHAVVFLRKDVHDLLVEETPDRGKDASVSLDWSDVEQIKVLLSRRIKASTAMEGDFEELWTQVCEPHINAEDSFRYIIERTLLRPRDVLNFVRQAIQIAVSRDHSRVQADDILAAEQTYSADMLNDLRYEIRDVFPSTPDVLNAFIGSDHELSRSDLELALQVEGVEEGQLDSVVDSLTWFGFIGVLSSDAPRYSYEVGYDVNRLRGGKANSAADRFVIHPAFRRALEM